MTEELTDLIKNSFITLTPRQVSDLDMILNKGFDPLKTFLNEEDYKSVVDDMRLSDGTVWPMPIVLSVDDKKYEQLKKQKKVVLKDQTGIPLVIMDLDEIYEPDLEKECEKVYGTTDTNHPYVKQVLLDGKKYYVSGNLKVINQPKYVDFKDLRMSPDEVKDQIKKKGWKKVVGFQTRNPIHKHHFHASLKSLEQVGDDAGLLVHPVVGETQEGDVDYHIRLKCYREILPHYPKDKTMLSLLPLSMRMAGPREALWHAIVRKNYGCTHFMVGRDHAGPSTKTKDGEDFYGKFDAFDLVKSFEKEIGIEIVPAGMVCYVEEKDQYFDLKEAEEKGYRAEHLSGTKMRELLKNGEEIPEWFTFSNVAKELQKFYKPKAKSGFALYLVGLSGSGKSTLAEALEYKLREIENERQVTLLDGDVVRLNLTGELGFSKEDRSKNVRRIGFVSDQIVKHGGISICANIAPYEEDRKYNRDLISNNGGYIEIFVDTPIEICEKRDIKGLYKAAREGKIKAFTGISDPFEEPENADIKVNGDRDIDELVDEVLNHLKKEGYII
jgi:sulfate adenylyltransferase